MTNVSAGLNGQRGPQRAALDHTLHQPVEVNFLNVNAAGIDRVDDAGIDVDTQHLAA